MTSKNKSPYCPRCSVLVKINRELRNDIEELHHKLKAEMSTILLPISDLIDVDELSEVITKIVRDATEDSIPKKGLI